MDINVNETTGDILLFPLKQLGATDITRINSHLYYIKFHLTDTVTISYVYNINTKNKYFLQRISPYPLPKGLFTTTEEIVDFIKRDIRKFQSACHSSNFERFLSITNNLSHISSDVESLFLNYNIPKDQMQLFHDQINSLNDLIYQIKSNSAHIILKE